MVLSWCLLRWLLNLWSDYGEWGLIPKSPWIIFIFNQVPEPLEAENLWSRMAQISSLVGADWNMAGLWFSIHLGNILPTSPNWLSLHDFFRWLGQPPTPQCQAKRAVQILGPVLASCTSWRPAICQRNVETISYDFSVWKDVFKSSKRRIWRIWKIKDSVHVIWAMIIPSSL